MGKHIKISEAMLTEMYLDYNSRYFGGKLPKLPIEINSSSRLAAHALVMVHRERGRGYKEWRFSSPRRISFSDQFKWTKSLLSEVMLHEMVHVLMAHNNECDYGVGMHGENFYSHCYDLEKRYGVVVSR